MIESDNPIAVKRMTNGGAVGPFASAFSPGTTTFLMFHQSFPVPSPAPVAPPVSAPPLTAFPRMVISTVSVSLAGATNSKSHERNLFPASVCVMPPSASWLYAGSMVETLPPPSTRIRNPPWTPLQPCAGSISP